MATYRRTRDFMHYFKSLENGKCVQVRCKPESPSISKVHLVEMYKTTTVSTEQYDYDEMFTRTLKKIQE